jgi:ABC-2 type transport system permease protein
MNRFIWLLRREFWEHRAIWIAPAIVLVVLLLGAVTGNVFLGGVTIDTDVTSGDVPGETGGLTQEDIDELKSIRGPEDLDKLERLEKLDDAKHGEARTLSAGEALSLIPAKKRQALLAIVFAGVAAVMFLVLGVIGFFYSLDALYADRRDRSVLFWKSLPLSDMETVLSKFAVAAVAIPLVAAAAALAGQLIVAAGGSIKLAFTGGEAGIMWVPQILGGSALAAVGMALVCALWYAPVAAYLLLASAWAPKSPFLWALLPPIALSMLEKIAFGSSAIWNFIKYRGLAPFQALFGNGTIKSESFRPGDLFAGLMQFLLSQGMLLGLVATAALLAAAIWVRRYRDEST